MSGYFPRFTSKFPVYPLARGIMGKPDVELFIKRVGRRICELRKERNMTQLDLAVKSNMDESQIQRLETGRSSPTIKTLYKVINGLDIEFETFFSFPKK